MALSLSELEKLTPKEAASISSLRTGKSLDTIETQGKEQAMSDVSNLISPLAGISKAAVGLGIRGFTSILKTKNKELGKTYSKAQQVAQQIGLRGTEQVTPEWINANKELLSKTGWEMNMDGSLYQAIPGAEKAKVLAGEKFGVDFSKGTGELYTKKGATLSTVLDWPELYKSFPELKSMPIESILNRSGARGRFTGKSIELAEYQTPEDVKKTLLHEVTHATQFIEGMVNGTNADYILTKKYGIDLPSFISRHLSAADDLKSTFNKDVISTKFSKSEINDFVSGMTKSAFNREGQEILPINLLTKAEERAINRVEKLPTIEKAQIESAWEPLKHYQVQRQQANIDYMNTWGEAQARSIADYLLSKESVTNRIGMQVEETGGTKQLQKGEILRLGRKANVAPSVEPREFDW